MYIICIMCSNHHNIIDWVPYDEQLHAYLLFALRNRIYSHDSKFKRYSVISSSCSCCVTTSSLSWKQPAFQFLMCPFIGNLNVYRLLLIWDYTLCIHTSVDTGFSIRVLELKTKFKSITPVNCCFFIAKSKCFRLLNPYFSECALDGE